MGRLVRDIHIHKSAMRRMPKTADDDNWPKRCFLSEGRGHGKNDSTELFSSTFSFFYVILFTLHSPRTVQIYIHIFPIFFRNYFSILPREFWCQRYYRLITYSDRITSTPLIHIMTQPKQLHQLTKTSRFLPNNFKITKIQNVRIYS